MVRDQWTAAEWEKWEEERRAAWEPQSNIDENRAYIDIGMGVMQVAQKNIDGR